MGSKSSPDSSPSPAKKRKEKKSNKKGEKRRKKGSKGKEHRSRSRSLKETGAFERVLNNYHSTGGAASVGDEHWLNLALELKPLDEMVGDRGRLMEEVFAILGGDQQLNELLPEVIRKANHSPEEIRELLVSECKRMTDEDILDVLKGRKAVVPANRKQPTENSRRGSSSSRKSVERVDPAASGEPTPSQMELLELEMRARAIKSLMHKQTVPETNPETVLSSGTGDGQIEEPETELQSTEAVSTNETPAGNEAGASYIVTPPEPTHSEQVIKEPKAPEDVIEPIATTSHSNSSKANEANSENATGAESESGLSKAKMKRNLPMSDDLLITEISDEEMDPL